MIHLSLKEKRDSVEYFGWVLCKVIQRNSTYCYVSPIELENNYGSANWQLPTLYCHINLPSDYCFCELYHDFSFPGRYEVLSVKPIGYTFRKRVTGIKEKYSVFGLEPLITHTPVDKKRYKHRHVWISIRNFLVEIQKKLGFGPDTTRINNFLSKIIGSPKLPKKLPTIL